MSAKNKDKLSPRKNGQNKQKNETDTFIPRMVQDADGTPAETAKSSGNSSQRSGRRRRSNTGRNTRNEASDNRQSNAESAPQSQSRGEQPKRSGEGGNSAPRRSEQRSSRRPRRRPAGQANQQNNAQQPAQDANRPRSNRNQGQEQTQGQGKSGQRRGQRGQSQNKRQDGSSYRQNRSNRQRPAASLRGKQKRGSEQPHFSPQVLSLKDGGKGGRSNNRNRSNQPQESRGSQTKAQENTHNLSRNSLKVIPLGGLCEIGRNMTVFEYGNDMIVIDVGIGFPEEFQPGIDSVIQDYSYVINNKHKLKGIFITHGHEDHIGALSHFYRALRMPVPLYGTPLTAELIKLKLADRGARQYVDNVQTVQAGETRKAGVFSVEFIHINHSIADACSLAINTPVGMVVHSGDFKIDYTPIHGEPANLARLTELGNEGVLLLLCESTNVERPGFSMSERSVGESFEEHFANAQGRIFVATFSSNVSRIQQIITAAEKDNRKVALVGRSMLNVFNAANSLGYLKMKKNTLIELRDVNRYRPEQVCIISTGSQGEPMSALTRMAFAEHRNVEIREGDTVIISATPIPGNEKPIYRVIDELYKRGAKVIYSSMAEVHVSGHGYREEIKLMHQLTKPKYFLPVHGEYRMLYMHAELANSMGQAWDSIYVLNNGDIFETTGDTARIGGYTNAGSVLIDGNDAAAGDTPVMQERRDLSDEGVVAITVAFDPKSGRIAGQPSVATSGFVFDNDVRKLENDCQQYIMSFIKKNHKGKDMHQLVNSAQFRNQLNNFFYNHTRRRPVLLISVLELQRV